MGNTDGGSDRTLLHVDHTLGFNPRNERWGKAVVGSIPGLILFVLSLQSTITATQRQKCEICYLPSAEANADVPTLL